MSATHSVPDPAISGSVSHGGGTTLGNANLDTEARSGSIARRYRPRVFSDLIGQDVLVRTFSNTLASARVSQAYVLTGIRGTGKTTTARIMARALNCETGLTPAPCGVCANCRSILDERNVDVLELDAASRTGVEDMRDLLEGVHYAPVQSRYKVYILDEAHMLSKAAFNALLKTLEEPPAHAIFFLATTEIRKIPATVLSRCQRFDLRPVDPSVLSPHLCSVSSSEGVSLEISAADLIAKAGGGSVRDALSILDQAISSASDTIVTEDAVRAMLGMADSVRLYDLLGALFGGDTLRAFALFSDILGDGGDPTILIRDLAEGSHYVALAALSDELLDTTTLSRTQREAILRAAASGPAAAQFAWKSLVDAAGGLDGCVNPRQAAGMALVRIALEIRKTT